MAFSPSDNEWTPLHLTLPFYPTIPTIHLVTWLRCQQVGVRMQWNQTLVTNNKSHLVFTLYFSILFFPWVDKDNRNVDFFIIAFLGSINLPFSTSVDFFGIREIVGFTAIDVKQHTCLVIMHVEPQTHFSLKLFSFRIAVILNELRFKCDWKKILNT